MSPAVEPVPMEVTYEFPPQVFHLYHKSLEFDHWFVRNFGRWPFDASILKNRQTPHSRNPQESEWRGFNEFYMATQYIEAGYEVLLTIEVQRKIVTEKVTILRKGYCMAIVSASSTLDHRVNHPTCSSSKGTSFVSLSARRKPSPTRKRSCPISVGSIKY